MAARALDGGARMVDRRRAQGGLAKASAQRERGAVHRDRPCMRQPDTSPDGPRSGARGGGQVASSRVCASGHSSPLEQTPGLRPRGDAHHRWKRRKANGRVGRLHTKGTDCQHLVPLMHPCTLRWKDSHHLSACGRWARHWLRPSADHALQTCSVQSCPNHTCEPRTGRHDSEILKITLLMPSQPKQAAVAPSCPQHVEPPHRHPTAPKRIRPNAGAHGGPWPSPSEEQPTPP